MLKDRLHELLEKSEEVTSESKTDDVDKSAVDDTDGRENEAFDDEEENEDDTEVKSEDKEKKSEEKPKMKKTKEQTEVDIEELERQKAEEKALEEFIEDHKLPDDLGRFLDDIGKFHLDCLEKIQLSMSKIFWLKYSVEPYGMFFTAQL